MLLPLIVPSTTPDESFISPPHSSRLIPFKLLTTMPLPSVGELLKILGPQFLSGNSILSAGLSLALWYKMIGVP